MISFNGVNHIYVVLPTLDNLNQNHLAKAYVVILNLKIPKTIKVNKISSQILASVVIISKVVRKMPKIHYLKNLNQNLKKTTNQTLIQEAILIFIASIIINLSIKLLINQSEPLNIKIITKIILLVVFKILKKAKIIY